jgi:hypothetical protein
MYSLRQHRTPRWLNARMRLARLTIPQWLALGVAAALGLALYLGAAQIPFQYPLDGVAFYLRLLVAGPPSGLLGVLFFALADDRREPFIRQAVLFSLRRHRFDREDRRDRTRP